MQDDGPNPSGLCMCGCGGKTSLAAIDRKKRGDVAGTPVRYIYGHRQKMGGHVRGERYSVDPVTGCWNWLLQRSELGYGTVSNKRGGTRLAHRRAYEEANGPIPSGHEVHHLCANRACVNPAHLRALPKMMHSGAVAEAQRWKDRALAAESERDGLLILLSMFAIPRPGSVLGEEYPHAAV